MNETTIPSIGIKWDARFLSWSGYSSAARNSVLGLDRAGVNVQAGIINVTDPGFLEAMDPEARGRLQNLVERRVPREVYVVSCVPYVEQDLYRVFREMNPGFRTYVGYTMFETDRVPSSWVAPCNGMDEIWVPSRFNQATFARGGVRADKLRVVPLGIDTGRFDPAAVAPLPIPDRRNFCFLSVFEWLPRKGWDVLLRAYLEAFSKADDVSLLLHTRNLPGKTGRELAAEFLTSLGRNLDESPHLVISDRPIPDAAMPSLFRSADAFVLPTRGEGWGLPFMEAMSMGLPTIGTGWSANLDFMDATNSYLIGCEVVEVKEQHLLSGLPTQRLYQEHCWAEPSVAETARLMREVYDHREAARAKGAVARDHIVRNYDHQQVAGLIMKELARMAGGKTG